MPENGQYGGNMKHVVIRLIKFVAVDVSFEKQLEPAVDIVAAASENKHTSFWDITGIA
jgi:hypothetical protein